MKKIVELDSIQKKFKEKVIFDSFSCTIYENEFVAIIGKSGCGKSTLLNMIGLLDSPDSGEIILFGEKGINKLGRMLLDEGQTSPNATTQKRMVDELTQKTEEEMIHVRNLGKKSLQEVKDKIKELGLSFRQNNG